MKTIKLLGLMTLIASSVASANTAITFPGEGRSVPNAPITFQTSSKTPITFYNGYTIKDGIFRSEVNTCDIDVDNPAYEAMLTWEGKTPKLLIVGNTDPFPCRAGFTEAMEVDLTVFFQDAPTHIFQYLEVANRVNIQRNF
ncbi:hypothetical protein AB6Q85_003693 [Vibrio cholerae]|nr:hypothetical protein [Vibrio cholerae]EFH72498.1 conserved hypothetical protein [Vibrio cholerae RC385]EKF9423169.1 hypothetical protein [Vibrio cholerae]